MERWQTNKTGAVKSLFQTGFRCSANIGQYLSLACLQTCISHASKLRNFFISVVLMGSPAWSLSFCCFCRTHMPDFQKKITSLAAKAGTYLSLGMHFLLYALQVTELQRYWVSKKTLWMLTLGKGRGHSLCFQVTPGAQWWSHPSPSQLSSEKHILNLFRS